MTDFEQPCVRIPKALYGLPEAGFDFFEYVKKHLIAERWQPSPASNLLINVS